MFVSSRLWAAALVGGIWAAAATALGVHLGIAIAVTNVVLLALVGIDVMSAPEPVTLNPVRKVPGVVTISDASGITITVRNPVDRMLRVEVRDVSPNWAAREPLRHHTLLPPHRSRELDGSITPARRGLLRFGSLVLRTYGRFGLAGRQAKVELPAVTKVYPLLPGRRETTARLEMARALQAGERSSVARGGRSEFDSLREYHTDDDFRAINWRATARAGKAISNLYREDRNQQVILLLDAGRMMATSVAGIPRFDHAIDAAVAVSELAIHLGDHVGMVVFGRQVMGILAPKSGRSQPKRIIDMLFNTYPTLEAADYRGAFSALLQRHRRRAMLVLLSELTDKAAMDPIFQAIPQLTKRHLVVMGAVSDPSLETSANSIPSSSEEVFMKAAAAEALLSRRETARSLGGLGVRVLDAPAGKLAAAVSDAYLSAKSSGRL